MSQAVAYGAAVQAAVLCGQKALPAVPGVLFQLVWPKKVGLDVGVLGFLYFPGGSLRLGFGGQGRPEV